METIDITLNALILVFALLGLPLIISGFYKLNLSKSLLNATFRMTVQLFLIGIFLKYLFLWNNFFINILWLLIMILIAVFSAIKESAMKPTKILLPVFLSFSIATFSVVLYLNYVVIKLAYLFDARYLIVLGGMLLGNSLRGNIVGINNFYQTIRKERKTFLYTLALGAELQEALLPYLQQSVKLALKPTIASMATIGIVALPGMMTGVILGGASPDVAIKYQIMIMIAILVSTLISVLLTILMTIRLCFNKYGVLKEEVFI